MTIVAKWTGVVVGMLGVLGAVGWAEGQKFHPPKVQELGRAEKLVEEVFGKDIARARTPADRQKLAQEILKAAREEEDPAVRYAALQAARKLAVEALDGKLGLEIVREIVNTYQPLEEMSKGDRLAEADRLWQQAERSQGREKLSKQLEAAEAYLYLLPEAGGLTKNKIERRLEELGNALSPIITPNCIPDISKGDWVWGHYPSICVLYKNLPPVKEGNRVFLAITADDYYEIYLNGVLIGKDGDWGTVEVYELTSHLSKPAELVVVAKDNGMWAGIWLAFRILQPNSNFEDVYLDRSWKTFGKPLQSFDWNAIKSGPWLPPKKVWCDLWKNKRLSPTVFEPK